MKFNFKSITDIKWLCDSLDSLEGNRKDRWLRLRLTWLLRHISSISTYREKTGDWEAKKKKNFFLLLFLNSHSEAINFPTSISTTWRFKHEQILTKISRLNSKIEFWFYSKLVSRIFSSSCWSRECAWEHVRFDLVRWTCAIIHQVTIEILRQSSNIWKIWHSFKSVFCPDSVVNFWTLTSARGSLKISFSRFLILLEFLNPAEIITNVNIF